MKTRTIKKVIAERMGEWFASINDENVRKLAKDNTIVTGGCIASMLLKEPVNDFDVYFRTHEAALAMAKYYVQAFKEANSTGLDISVDAHSRADRIQIRVGSVGVAREIGAKESPEDDEGLEEQGELLESSKVDASVKGKPFRPTFISSNAIMLAGKVQLVFRFFGEPGDIHKNYDFIHCTNYWMSWNGDLVLNQAALESLLAKELRYVGSRYPICSMFRIRKFVKRGWSIHAGQMLKIAFQISELDLSNVATLEDQLTGVDVAYFIGLVATLKESNPEKVTAAYLSEILDRMF